MKQSRIALIAIACLIAAEGGLLRAEDPAAQSGKDQSSGEVKPKGLFDALLDTAVKTAGQVDRIGLDITRMTDAEEMDLGAAIDKEVLSHTPALDDAKAQRRIERLLKLLIEQRQRREIKYTVRILDADDVNAYSVAGGYLYVTRGFLKEFTDDAAVAMALGHEVGHVDLRHCVEKVQYQTAGRKMVGDLADIAQIAYTTIRSAYAKEQEFDADDYGFKASCHAGFKPEALLGFVSRLVAYERQLAIAGNGGTADEPALIKELDGYLATHPPTPERLKRLESLSSSYSTNSIPGK